MLSLVGALGSNGVPIATLGPNIVAVLTQIIKVLTLACIKWLPLDPFDPFLTELEQTFHGAIRTHWINWLNWFIPVHWCVVVFSSWLTCVLGVYAVLLIGRLIGVLSK